MASEALATRTSVCKRGHDPTEPGALNAQGKCKECVKITSREVRAEIRAGDFSRMRKPICKHGHDKRVVGISPNGGCAECRRARDRRLNAERTATHGGYVADPSKIHFRKPICPQGHDKRITGVTTQYACLVCYREAVRVHSLKLRRKWAGFDGEPQHVPGLKGLREAAGLTGKEMAARIGISRAHLCHLERGDRKAGRRVLAAIVDAVAELRADALESRRPIGRVSRLLWALNEAERRGEPTARMAGELAGERRAMGCLLKELRKRGLVERFEPRPGPKGGRNPGGAAWLLTAAGRRVLRDAA